MPAAGRVLVIGSANVDLVTRVKHHPHPGQTVLGADVRRYPGGKGANQAVGAARLGADACLAGRVGADAEGELLAASLREAGVTVDSLRQDTTRPSGIALIVVDGAGENTIVVSPGANHGVEPADVDAALRELGPVAVVVLQCELPVHTVDYAARTAASQGARVVLNLAPPTSLDAECLALADPLVVNVHEAAHVLGERPGRDTVQRLRDHGPASAVVTLGADGALAGDVRHVSSHPAPQVEVVDTTGAGDAFTGALAARLAAGGDIHAATRFAVRAGSAAVRAGGAQGSFPTAEEVDAE